MSDRQIRSRQTALGIVVDEYSLPTGGRLLVPVIPEWTEQELRIERRQRNASKSAPPRD